MRDSLNWKLIVNKGEGVLSFQLREFRFVLYRQLAEDSLCKVLLLKTILRALVKIGNVENICHQLIFVFNSKQVRCACNKLDQALRTQTNQFKEALRSSDGHRSGQVCLYICLYNSVDQLALILLRQRLP